MTAISQYKWWQPVLPLLEAHLDEGVAAAQAILEQIQRYDAALATPLKQGFTFDLQYREGGFQLIELNGFGALQATGACLFNWVSDRHILYDEGDDDDDRHIIVRICKE